MSLQKAIEFIQERREEKTKATIELRQVLEAILKQAKSRLDDQKMLSTDRTHFQSKSANPLKMPDIKEEFLDRKDPNTGRMNKQDTLDLIRQIFEERKQIAETLEDINNAEKTIIDKQIQENENLIRVYIQSLNTLSRLTFEQKLFIDTFQEVLSSSERQATLEDIQAAVVFIQDVIDGSGENVNES